MPKRKILHGTALERVTVNKQWIVYSTRRTHCFSDEIQRGLFPKTYVCGCTACYHELPKPGPLVTESSNRGAVPQKNPRV